MVRTLPGLMDRIRLRIGFLRTHEKVLTQEDCGDYRLYLTDERLLGPKAGLHAKKAIVTFFVKR